MDYIKVGGSGVRRTGSANMHCNTLGQAGKPRASAPVVRAQPVAGKRSAACQREDCAKCWMLTCSHKCHKRGA